MQNMLLLANLVNMRL